MGKTSININTFLGLNEQGETQLKLGEASTMTNWRLVDEYKPRVIEGYEQLFATIGAVNVRGMWAGEISNLSRLLFACNGHIYRDVSISGSVYDSLVTSYTNVDVVLTTALNGAEGGTTGIDNVVILKNSFGVQMSEVTQANIDLVASVGKFYFDADEKLNYIVAKGAYVNIAAARTGLGTTTGYYRIGTLTDAATSFFLKDGSLYILNGAEYYKWSGSGSIAAVTGYRPTIAINAPPAGGGTLYEQINLLTGAKSQTFSTVTGSTSYVLAESDVDTVDSVYLNGVLKTITTDYTLDDPITTVTLTGDPGDGEGNLEVNWTKANSANRALVTANKYIRAFGNNDERIFLFGNADARLHSGITLDGTSTAEYFEATAIDYVGSGDDITDICQQYDRQTIYTDGGAYYSYQEDVTTSGVTITSFPIFPLNNKIGNVAPGQVQLILNNPYSIHNGLYNWLSTTVRDERNATYLSKRVQPSMDAVDLSTAITYDYEKMGEYWLCVGKTIWAYNYRLDAWYKFVLLDTPTCFIEIDGQMYFGTDDGRIMKFDSDLRSFNGSNIRAELYMGFTDAGSPNRVKYLEESHIALKAESHVGLDVYWETNKKVPKDTPKPIGYNNIDFDDIDFDDWSFEGNYNPQPFPVKTKAKDWVYFRHVFISDSDYYTAQILEVTLEPSIGGVL
jgi:hypothetical protein